MKPWRLVIRSVVLLLAFALIPSIAFSEPEPESAVASSEPVEQASDTSSADELEADTEKKGLGDSISSGMNVLNKVGGGLLSKVGGVANSVLKKNVKAPATVAVLPSTGEGTDEEKNEIRIALHNSLGATNIQSLKPAEVDRLLVVAEQTTGKQWADLTHKELTAIMAVEGLVIVNVEKIDRLYAGAYAHYEVGVKVSLYSAKEDGFIWEKAESKAERKGGVSINPLGMIATAISSARILSDAVRQVLVNTVARNLAADIPQPSTLRRSAKPIVIDMVVSNGVEGPFSIGEEITVLAKAEPGLVMFFDINGLAEGLPLDEKAEGEYIGSYVVTAGENAKNLFVSIKATRVKDKQTIVWRVPGKVGVDTKPPGDVQDLVVRSTSEGTSLIWQAPAGEDLADLTYLLEKANVSDGIYQILGDVAITEYLDQSAEVGQDYYYRIRSLDKAGNEGTVISKRVTVFKPGPTDLGGLLEGDINFPAIGNPYRLSQDVIVAASANINFDEGTILELQPDQKITVQGKLTFGGTKDSPISVRGDGWKIIYDGSGASHSRIDNARLSGLNASIHISASELVVNDVTTDGVNFQLEQSGKLRLNQAELINAAPAIRLIAGDLALNSVKFVNNVQAIINADNGSQVSMSMKNVVFDKNEVALSSAASYTIANADFSAATLTDIQAMLDGPIALDWSTIKNGKILVRGWLEPNINQLKRHLAQQNWSKATKVLTKINQVVPSDGMKQLQATLATADDGFRQVGYQTGGQLGALLAEGNRIMWIQSETLPTAQAKSEELSERAMLRKFGKSYTKELFPNKSNTEIAKAIRGIKFNSAVDASQYLYNINKGLLSDVWVLHVVNQSVLKSLLASAGLGSSSGSTKVFTVNIDNSAASNVVLDILEAQKIRYKVSKSSKAPTAYRLSANIVVSESSSQISKNLKIAEATLRFTLEDTRSNKVLGSWKATGSASAFGASDSQKKAIENGVNKIKTLLVRRLWEVDSMPSVAKAPAKAKKPVTPKREASAPVSGSI